MLQALFMNSAKSKPSYCILPADPPDPAKIPGNDVIGVTAVILTCGFRDREFVRVGYYVNNDYIDPEMRENPPPVPQYDKLQRDIFASKPIVTRFKIDWDDTSVPPPDAVPIIESSSEPIGSPMSGLNGADGNLNFPSKADVVVPTLGGEGTVGGPGFNGNGSYRVIFLSC